MARSVDFAAAGAVQNCGATGHCRRWILQSEWMEKWIGGNKRLVPPERVPARAHRHRHAHINWRRGPRQYGAPPNLREKKSVSALTVYRQQTTNHNISFRKKKQKKMRKKNSRKKRHVKKPKYCATKITLIAIAAIPLLFRLSPLLLFRYSSTLKID